MIFFENERRQVRTFRVSFREIARIFATLGGFYLGWYWLSLAKYYNVSLDYLAGIVDTFRNLK